MMRRWTFILTVAAAVAGGATSASADSFDLNSCHLSGGCGGLSLPYGTVTLTANMTGGVNVSVTGPSFIFFAGGGDLQGAPQGQNVIFAFNGVDITAADIQNETATAPGAVTLSGIAGTFNVNGQPAFGDFGFGIACSCNGQSDQISKIEFTVVNATIADLTFPNAAGVLFIADVGFSASRTGVVDASSVPVPGPIVGAGLPGLIMACGGLLALSRRRRQKIA
jgi:hypothetical protein